MTVERERELEADMRLDGENLKKANCFTHLSTKITWCIRMQQEVSERLKKGGRFY